MMVRKRNNYDRFLENRVDEGVELHRTEDLPARLPDPGSDFLIQNAIDHYNHDREQEPGAKIGRLKLKAVPPKEAYELYLPSTVGFNETVEWLGQAASRFSTGILSVDTRKSSTSNRATDMALAKIERLMDKGRASFTFTARDSALSLESAQYDRVQRVRELIGSYSLPGIDFVVINPDQDIIDAQQTGEGIQELTVREGIAIPPFEM